MSNFDYLVQVVEMDLISAKSDKNHAESMIANQNGDESYWRNEVKRANRIMRESSARLKDLKSGKGFNVAHYVLGLLEITK